MKRLNKRGQTAPRKPKGQTAPRKPKVMTYTSTKPEKEERKEPFRKFISIGIGALILLIALLFVKSFLVLVPAGHVGVLFDKLGEGIALQEFNGAQEGWALKWPIVQSVTMMDVRTQTVEYRGDQAITPKDKNGINFQWDVIVRYRLDKGQAAEVFKTKGPDYADKIIGTGLRAKTREIMGEYAQEDLPEKRLELSGRVRDALQDRINEEANSEGLLKTNFIIVEAVDLRNLEFNGKIEERIIQKQQRLQEAQEREYQLQIAEKDRQIQVVNADAVRQRKVLEARGEADAILVVAEAKAKGIQLVNDAYQAMPPQYVATKFAEAIQPTDKVYLGFESLTGQTLGVLNYNQLLGANAAGVSTTN